MNRIKGFILPATTIIALSISACQEQAAKEGNSQSEFYVRGNCGMCEERIEKAVSGIPGVVTADWNVETKNMKVTYDSSQVKEITIQQVVANSGHETKQVQTPQAVHDALPECCKKGGMM